VVEHPRFFLGEDHDSAGSVGEAFEHAQSPGAGAPPIERPRGSPDPVLPPRQVERFGVARSRAPAEAPHAGEYTPDLTCNPMELPFVPTIGSIPVYSAKQGVEMT
jgi:hypothetical protein